MDFTLKQYEQTVQLCNRQFGESCQAILMRLNADGSEGSVIAVSGYITSVSPGDSLPVFVRKHLSENGATDKLGFINEEYPGMVLRSSLQFIRSEDDTLSGCLCIHHNIMHIKAIISFLEELTRPQLEEDDEGSVPIASPGGKMYHAADIHGFVDSVMQDYLVGTLGKNSFSALDKAEKLSLISELDNKGVFLVKGSINLVASRMEISKFSIYNYLDEVRTDKWNAK